MCGSRPERPQASFQGTPRSKRRDCATLGPADLGGQAPRRDPRGVKEGAAAAGDDVQGVAALGALVMVDVAGQHEGFARLRVEAQVLGHLGPRPARIAEQVHRIGHDHERRRIGGGPVGRAQELALARDRWP